MIESESPEKSSETTSKASSAIANDGSKHLASNLSTDAVELVLETNISGKIEKNSGSSEVIEIAQTVKNTKNHPFLDQLTNH